MALCWARTGHATAHMIEQHFSLFGSSNGRRHGEVLPYEHGSNVFVVLEEAAGTAGQRLRSGRTLGLATSTRTAMHQRLRRPVHVLVAKIIVTATVETYRETDNTAVQSARQRRVAIRPASPSMQRVGVCVRVLL